LNDDDDTPLPEQPTKVSARRTFFERVWPLSIIALGAALTTIWSAFLVYLFVWLALAW
jgi:fatty acid desaturase